jgi:hypothetical protein
MDGPASDAGLPAVIWLPGENASPFSRAEVRILQ